MTHKDSVSLVMKIFAEEYPTKFSVTDSRLKIWCQMLKGFPTEQILAAGYHLAATRTDWPPDIATMREQVLRFANGELHKPTGQEAWENILKKFKYEDYPLSDFEKAALAQVGTIYDLKRSQNTAADRIQFVRAFDNLVKKRDTERATLPEVRALVEQNVPFLPEPEPDKKALPVTETTIEDPPDDDDVDYPTPEEVADYVRQLSEKIALRDQNLREERIERAAIKEENETP